MSIVLVVTEMEVVVLSVTKCKKKANGVDKCYALLTSLLTSRHGCNVRAADGSLPKYFA